MGVRRAILAAALVLSPPGGSAAGAERDIPVAPLAQSAPLALTMEELFAWDAAGPLADERNVSHVPLAGRFVNPGPGPDPNARRDPDVRVLFAPDGMNNFGNYLEPQPKFNLYTFTHWAQVDTLAWFAGTAQHGIMLPARPWVDAAHRNGVKVIGTVFLAPLAWGGSPETVEALVHQEPDGRFPAADQLVAIARHYGFDGWLINQETDVSPDLARRVVRFTAYLTRIAPEPMEIHWYDAMLPEGRVIWQNALNERNAALLQDGATRVSDAMFLNYQWSVEGLRKGALVAEAMGRSRYELYIGADLWPARTNAQAAFRNSRWLRDLREGGTGRGLGSIALFAPNFNFNAGGEHGDFQRDPGDVEASYDGAVRLFAGDDHNMASGDFAEAAPAGAWEGIAALVPARSTITSLPFETSFNTGHGLVDARNGHVVGGPWHDMARQEPLPSWQFAYTPASALEIGYDFARPWRGGSSLRLEPKKPAARIEVPLFLTNLPIDRQTCVTVVAATRSTAYRLRLSLADGSETTYAFLAGDGWRQHRWCIGEHAGKVVRRISLVIESQSKGSSPGVLNLGAILIRNDCPDGAQATENHEKSRPNESV